MHPEFLREMTAQRQHEMRARAHQNRLARLAIRVGRRARDLADEAYGFVIPPIPDYVDGSFQTGPAVGEANQEPAAHHAA